MAIEIENNLSEDWAQEVFGFCDQEFRDLDVGLF